MKVLKQAEIANKAPDRRPVALPVPEWGDDCGVLIRRWDGRMREQFAKTIKGEQSDYEVSIKAVVEGVVDEAGEFVFATAEQVEKTIVDPDIIQRIGYEVLRVNRMIKGALEDSKKN